jgi:CO/xanthine dehydrogenase Mo-binding subunit
MGRMIRKQIYITAEQEALVKRRAEALGVSEADVFRRGIEAPGSASVSLPFDPQAWEEEMAFIRERARIQALGRTRGWTREELYDERLNRRSG